MLQLNNLRYILQNQIVSLSDSVGLCLSGGIDSVALLSVLLQNKKTVTVYSFTLENYISEDFKKAKELADRFKCKFVPIYLPVSLSVLKLDILRLHDNYGCIRKTDYECVWPFLYVYPVIAEPVIVTGLGAEGHFGTTKKGSIHYKNNLDNFRKQFFGRQNVNQFIQHKQLCEEYSIRYWFPFLSKEVYDFFIGTSWDDINKPKLKQPIIDLIDFDFVPKSSNLQVGSNIRNHFDKLLNTDWNLRKYKSVVGIFNSVNRGEFSGKRKLI